MDKNNQRVTVYVSQSREIVKKLENGEQHFVKWKYIREKYQEVADVFLEVYQWYVKKAEQIVEKPTEAESAVWAYASLKEIEQNDGYDILELSVPINEVIFFRMDNWSRRINCQYIGQNEAENKVFEKELNRIGVKQEEDVYYTGFYPIQKRQLVESWNNLFNDNEQLKNKVLNGESLLNIQAGLWTILPEWVVKNHTNDKNK